MTVKSLSPDMGRKLFDEAICSEKDFPLAFTYGGRRYKGFDGLECEYRELAADGFEAAWRIDAALRVRVSAKYCSAYGQSEYTAYFENTGTTPSEELSDIAALYHDFEGEDPVSRGILGDHQNYYAPYEIALDDRAAHFESLGGRATHVCFPYFNLVHGNGGTLIALGWAGTWDALFTRIKDGAKAVIRSNPEMKTVILPGESVRTGLVVLLPYSGRSDDDAMNLWRRWFLEYNMPGYDATGRRIEPFSTAFLATDTGLPNSDGSISERYFTWRPTMEKMLEEGIIPDFRWFDAGWYSDPAGNTVESDWWGTIGSWEMDKEKWPGDTFRESVDEFHKHGIKTLVWFEPERVTHVEDLVRNYGYKAEWAIEAGGAITNNIGDPECLEWTVGRIIAMMEKNGVDLYREDNNANHNETWRRLDGEQTAKLGVPRFGISENNSIVGHYKLWDRIIAYCAAAGKCTYVDSCASGGGRNDIESLRRGIPFMRSDADRTTSSLRLSMSASFNRWIPFHGSCSKETEGQLDASKGKGSDAYVYRASYLPVLNYGEQFVHNSELDFDNMRFFINEWRSVSHVLTKDMYVLTPWHSRDDRFGWTAWAYDSPETNESLLFAFRMEECSDAECVVKLPFADEGSVYTIENADSGDNMTVPGATLRDGIRLMLDKPRSCLMYRINRT